MSFVYLKFPELEDFIGHLKKRRIAMCGIVALCERRTTDNGIPLIKLYYRLTAKDDQAHEGEPAYGDIIVCDITIYKGLDHERTEEYKAMQEKALAGIQKALKEAEITTIDAEYRVTE